VGHTKVRCKHPIVDEDTGGNDGGDVGVAIGYGDDNAGGGDYGNGGGAMVVSDFSAPAPAVVAAGGWEGGQGASGW
jgi:hypothetical protein